MTSPQGEFAANFVGPLSRSDLYGTRARQGATPLLPSASTPGDSPLITLLRKYKSSLRGLTASERKARLRVFGKNKVLGLSSFPQVTVLQDGVFLRIASKHLVPGDVIGLQGGEFVPADVRMLWSSNLHVDNSYFGDAHDVPLFGGDDDDNDATASLKDDGEASPSDATVATPGSSRSFKSLRRSRSAPDLADMATGRRQRKGPAHVPPGHTTATNYRMSPMEGPSVGLHVSESRHRAFRGASVVFGWGLAVVTATGKDTVLGKRRSMGKSEKRAGVAQTPSQAAQEVLLRGIKRKARKQGVRFRDMASLLMLSNVNIVLVSSQAVIEGYSHLEFALLEQQRMSLRGMSLRAARVAHPRSTWDHLARAGMLCCFAKMGGRDAQGRATCWSLSRRDEILMRRLHEDENLSHQLARYRYVYGRPPRVRNMAFSAYECLATATETGDNADADSAAAANGTGGAGLLVVIRGGVTALVYACDHWIVDGVRQVFTRDQKHSVTHLARSAGGGVRAYAEMWLPGYTGDDVRNWGEEQWKEMVFGRLHQACYVGCFGFHRKVQPHLDVILQQYRHAGIKVILLARESGHQTESLARDCQFFTKPAIHGKAPPEFADTHAVIVDIEAMDAHLSDVLHYDEVAVYGCGWYATHLIRRLAKMHLVTAYVGGAPYCPYQCYALRSCLGVATLDAPSSLVLASDIDLDTTHPLQKLIQVIGRGKALF